MSAPPVHRPYVILDEGFVVSGVLGACSRVVVTDGGDLVCTYVLRSGAGKPDYAVHQSRSTDGGRTWTSKGPVWPSLVGSASMSLALSRTAGDDLLLYGTSTPVDDGDDTWWDGERQALKQNDLVWARSRDGGRTWPMPSVIPMPIPGAAEAPGPMTELRGYRALVGRLVACYAPYNSFDTSVVVDRNQIMLVKSDDDGRSWSHTSMLRFADPDAGGAEAWVVELADGRLVGTSWSMSLRTGVDTPIPYALSDDGGAPGRPPGRPGSRARRPRSPRCPTAGCSWATTSERNPTPGCGWRSRGPRRPISASSGSDRPGWPTGRPTGPPGAMPGTMPGRTSHSASRP
ncbi:MAG: exo-alpha-sialidase [Chloroflexi bacterium]|nr:exo-alpha-sialidase [Chloroflexota bacterium]